MHPESIAQHVMPSWLDFQHLFVWLVVVAVVAVGLRFFVALVEAVYEFLTTRPGRVR